MASTEYPKWKYHGKLEALIVRTLEQEKLLGPDWKNSPADFKPAPQAQKPVIKAGK